jgi:hypothetical protein
VFILEQFDFHLGLEFLVFKLGNFVFQLFSGLNGENWVLDFLDLGEELLHVGICAFVVSGEVALVWVGLGVVVFVDLGNVAVMGGHKSFTQVFIIKVGRNDKE